MVVLFGYAVRCSVRGVEIVAIDESEVACVGACIDEDRFPCGGELCGGDSGFWSVHVVCANPAVFEMFIEFGHELVEVQVCDHDGEYPVRFE